MVMLSLVMMTSVIALQCAERSYIVACTSSIEENEYKLLDAEVQMVPVFHLPNIERRRQEEQRTAYIDIWEKFMADIVISASDIEACRSKMGNFNGATSMDLLTVQRYIRKRIKRERRPTAECLLNALRAQEIGCRPSWQGKALLRAIVSGLCKDKCKLPLPLLSRELSGLIGQFVGISVGVYCQFEPFMPPTLLRVPASIIFSEKPEYSMQGAALIKKSSLVSVINAHIKGISAPHIYDYAMEGVQLDPGDLPSVILSFLQRDGTAQVKASVDERSLQAVEGVTVNSVPFSLLVQKGHAVTKHRLLFPSDMLSYTLCSFVRDKLLEPSSLLEIVCTWCNRPLAKNLLFIQNFDAKRTTDEPLDTCIMSNCTAVSYDTSRRDMLHRGNGAPRFLCKLLSEDGTVITTK